ncbi:MAG: cyclase family protein [Chloroherpetonaceae bacterium]|nr:cyclase family protein [Chthonomonadaceae bacterium]MDW8208242.1 cyclase family protein [Chloroherpetonaceae bacterium]
MKLIDLSQPVFDAAPNCPAHPPVRSAPTMRHPHDPWHWETLTLASHTGSHVDAPLHRIPEGASIDAIPLEQFVGPACIADLRGIAPRTRITPDLLQARLPDHPLNDIIVLLATGWGDLRAKSDLWLYQSPMLTPEAAHWLVARRIRGVGIDHWGIGGWDTDNDAEVHAILLAQGIWIVEELRFPPEVFALPAPQTFMALPVHLRGHSGAWCRPVLIVREAG